MDLEWKRLGKEATRQGWRIQQGRKGQTVLIPPGADAEMVVVHNTPSDHRAFKNAVARMRRQGLQWPPKGKGKR